MKKSGLIIAALGLAFAAAPALANLELATKSACTACHAVDKKLVGPAYKDVAAKYKGKADAQKMLTEKIGGAKGHPEVKAKGEDLATILKWVLSL